MQHEEARHLGTTPQAIYETCRHAPAPVGRIKGHDGWPRGPGRLLRGRLPAELRAPRQGARQRAGQPGQPEVPRGPEGQRQCAERHRGERGLRYAPAAMRLSGRGRRLPGAEERHALRRGRPALLRARRVPAVPEPRPEPGGRGGHSAELRAGAAGAGRGGESAGPRRGQAWLDRVPLLRRRPGPGSPKIDLGNRVFILTQHIFILASLSLGRC